MVIVDFRQHIDYLHYTLQPYIGETVSWVCHVEHFYPLVELTLEDILAGNGIERLETQIRATVPASDVVFETSQRLWDVMTETLERYMGPIRTDHLYEYRHLGSGTVMVEDKGIDPWAAAALTREKERRDYELYLKMREQEEERGDYIPRRYRYA